MSDPTAREEPLVPPCVIERGWHGKPVGEDRIEVYDGEGRLQVTYVRMQNVYGGYEWLGSST